MQHPTSTTPHGEEHDTRKRQQTLHRAQAGNGQADQRRRPEIIREHLASPRAEDCQCPITPSSTLAELRALGAGRTAGRWVCPTLDAIRRRLGT
jgi:hypothetical protein